MKPCFAAGAHGPTGSHATTGVPADTAAAAGAPDGSGGSVGGCGVEMGHLTEERIDEKSGTQV